MTFEFCSWENKLLIQDSLVWLQQEAEGWDQKKDFP